MPEIVIAGAVRTPHGVLGGVLKNFTNHKLGEIVCRGLLERIKMDPGQIDEVIFGCVGQHSDAANVSRVIALTAGIRPEVPAFTVARNCASGLQAIVSAYQMIAAGDAELILAGGVEVMSAMPFVNRDLRFGKHLRHSVMVDSLWEGLTDPVCGQIMGRTAETLAEEFKIGRNEQDAFALLSHQRAIHAEQEGRFAEEIVPVTVPLKTGPKKSLPVAMTCDETPNPALTPEALALYPAVFKENGTVTAGNSCPVSDGAAAVVVTTAQKARSLKLEILGTVRGYAFAGLEPERMGLGPVYAVAAALKKAKAALSDIQLIEINESFAAQYLAVERALKIDRDITNVNGGAIALGHPVGETGTRLVVTLLHEMKRRDISLGIAALCVGGGQGGAVVLERA